MVKNTLISTSPVFLPGIFVYGGRLQDMHIGQPVRHQLRVIFDCFEIGAIAHIKAVAGLVEDMRFDGHFGGPVSLQQTDHRRRAAFIVIARQQEGRGCVCGDASRHAERPGVDEQLKIGAAVQAIDWVRSGRIAHARRIGYQFSHFSARRKGQGSYPGCIDPPLRSPASDHSDSPVSILAHLFFQAINGGILPE